MAGFRMGSDWGAAAPGEVTQDFLTTGTITCSFLQADDATRKLLTDTVTFSATPPFGWWPLEDLLFILQPPSVYSDPVDATSHVLIAFADHHVVPLW